MTSIYSPRGSAIVKRCQDLPGQELFQYLDEDGAVRDIGSADVNAYLREISRGNQRQGVSHLGGHGACGPGMQEFEEFDSAARAKRYVTRAIERVAKRLGNTQAVCRKCYVHPAVIEAYLDRSLMKIVQQRAAGELRGAQSAQPARGCRADLDRATHEARTPGRARIPAQKTSHGQTQGDGASEILRLTRREKKRDADSSVEPSAGRKLPSWHEKAQVVSGVDQDQIVPLVFGEWAEKRMRKRIGRHSLESRGFGAELIDGARFVMDRPWQPPGGDLDAGLHTPIAQNPAEDERPEKSANDPRRDAPNLAARAQPLADVVQNLGKVPVADAVVA